jgi:hypothetical protein
MTRTSPTLLLALGAAGAVIGWFLELGLVVSGEAAVIPPITLGTALGLLGVLVVLLALPVFRVVRKVPGAEVDPFYATRVVLLAKASSMSAAIVTGFAVSVLVFLLSRSVLPSGNAIAMVAVTAGGAILLLAGGLVAEKMCTLPPEDDGTKESE